MFSNFFPCYLRCLGTKYSPLCGITHTEVALAERGLRGRGNERERVVGRGVKRRKEERRAEREWKIGRE
jgi:hypothetical protein